MAGHNRHLRGDTGRTTGKVHGHTVIEAGDLLVGNFQDGTVGNSTTQLYANSDAYVWPFSQVRPVTTKTEFDDVVATQFVGVAMNGSLSGVTEDIDVATDGVFRYPMIDGFSAVTLGSRVSAVSPSANSGVGSGGKSQYVANNGTQNVQGTTAFLGTIVKTESGASFVDFQIITAASGGSIA